MQRWIASTVLSLALLTPAFAQDAKTAKKAPAKPAAPAPAAAKPIAPLDPRLKTPMAKLELKNGDTVVFLGDSITHQCLYTQYVEDYFYQRFPGVKINFHNAGVSGDRAADALARFDMDVAAYKPKYVTILLGMNDGAYKQWDKDTFAAYERDMLAILEKIQAIGATPIVMGPTMFDRNALLIKPQQKRKYEDEGSTYYNAVLAFYGTFMRDMAAERGLAYVDMFSALNKYTLEQRATNPNYSLILDAIHPDAPGQMVMASALLQDTNAPRTGVMVAAEFDGKSWKLASVPKASDVSGTAESLKFTFKANALPWVVPAEAQPGYDLLHAGHRHATEILRAQGLAPGKYELKIDGQSVGVFASQILASKIEIETNPKTPQYQQALAVAELNKEKNDKVMRPLRGLYSQLKGFRRKPDTTPESLAAFIQTMKPKLAELEKAKADYEQRIYDLAQPKPHTYEFTRVSMN